MAIGHIDITLRPIKLAFLVRPSDIEAVRTAIRISTFLWGGTYNPIIPVYKHKPKHWEISSSPRLRARDIVLGYLEAFDPDFVVPVGECANDDWELSDRELLKVDKILPDLDCEYTPCYGIGLFEILDYLYEREFKFRRRDPLNVVFPSVSHRYSLFLESFFGALPESIDDTISENYDAVFPIERPSVSIHQFHEYMSPRFLFPRRISSAGITLERMSGFRDARCIFLLDATKPMDVIDYWNLRAVGWTVIPVPIQLVSSGGLQEIAVDFIEDNYFPYKHNKEMYHRTTLLKSRNVSSRKLVEYAKSLKLRPLEHKSEPKLMLSKTYPRIWDNWARDKDGVECCSLTAKSRSYDFTDTPGDRLSLRTVDPPMMLNHTLSWKPRFANDVALRFYGHEHESLAEVIPEGGPEMARSFGALGLREWRFGGQGLVSCQHDIIGYFIDFRNCLRYIYANEEVVDEKIHRSIIEGGAL